MRMAVSGHSCHGGAGSMRTAEEPVTALRIFTISVAHIKNFPVTQSWVHLIHASGSIIELTSSNTQSKAASAFGGLKLI